MDYRPSYRNAHEQVDGAFDYKSFTYLVEARWRAAAPPRLMRATSETSR